MVSEKEARIVGALRYAARQYGWRLREDDGIALIRSESVNTLSCAFVTGSGGFMRMTLGLEILTQEQRKAALAAAWKFIDRMRVRGFPCVMPMPGLWSDFHEHGLHSAIEAAWPSRDTAKEDSRYPHKCPNCGKPAFVGFNQVEHKGDEKCER